MNPAALTKVVEAPIYFGFDSILVETITDVTANTPAAAPAQYGLHVLLAKKLPIFFPLHLLFLSLYNNIPIRPSQSKIVNNQSKIPAPRSVANTPESLPQHVLGRGFYLGPNNQ